MPEPIAERIAKDFGLTPVVATEIEFYLHSAQLLPQPVVIAAMEKACAESGIALAKAEAERGPAQYEMSLRPARDLAGLAHDTERFKHLMDEIFAPLGARADFAAKPSADAPGSGLHVHVHLEDAQGRNVFVREGDVFSPLLLQAVGGLLMLMNPCMPIFAPHEDSYRRFTAGPNPFLVCPTATNVPTTVSWGTNNRTTAIRLPSKPIDNKHIEHRVAGSDADVARVIDAVLIGIHYGIKEKCDPGTPVYGDASLPQYGLPALISNLADAEHAMKAFGPLKPYI